MNVEKICRICLETKKRIKSIYETVDNKYLPSVIEGISGVLIASLEEPLCKICGACSKAILQAELIIRKCRENYKLLQQQHSKHGQQNLKSEGDEDERSALGKCPVKEDYAAHIEAEFEHDVPENDMGGSHHIKDNVSKKDMENNQESRFAIRKEAKPSKALKNLLQEDSIHSSADKCEQQHTLPEKSIESQLTSPTSTRTLRKRKAPISEAAECSSKLRKYIRTVNVNKDYFFQCDMCEFNSYFATYFREHMQVQHRISQPRIFKCQQCDRTFLEYRYLQQHIAYQHEQQPRRKKFLCSECGKGFNKSNHLHYHQRSHLPKHQRPAALLVKCKHCSKEFSKLSISMHIKTVHSLERSFACVLCRSSFALAKGLQAHMKVCHPADVLVCPCCEVKFRVRSVYETHVQRGTCQKLDFNCDYCAWGFKSEKRLEKHKLQVHNQLMQQLSGTDGTFIV